MTADPLTCVEGRGHVWGPGSSCCLQCGLPRIEFDRAVEAANEEMARWGRRHTAEMVNQGLWPEDEEQDDE